MSAITALTPVSANASATRARVAAVASPRPYKEQDLLRPDVSVTEAGHVLWVLTSFESFDLLYTGRGLSTDAVADLLTATAERALLR